jgi:hypothetical protein
MNYTERDNYFSIYMKRKENLNKSKKNIFIKSNRTLKNSNVSNLNIHNEKSVKKYILETSDKKERSSISYIRNNLFNNKNNEIIRSDKIDDCIDDDDKIDYLQKKIFGILDIIDNFKAEFFKNDKKIFEKEEVNSKSNSKQIKTNYRVISNIENRHNIFVTNNTQPKNIFIKKNNNNHPKLNSQLVSEQKIKETLLKRRIDYSNSINKNIIKKKNKNLSQSQVYKNKKIFNNNTSRLKKLYDNLETGCDNSTREISEKIFNGGNLINKNRKTLINNLSRQNKIKGIKIKNFKQSTKLIIENEQYKCISERSQNAKKICKKYEFDFN